MIYAGSVHRPRLLILYAAYGDGHLQAARAILDALEGCGGEGVLVDLLEESHPILYQMTKRFYMHSYKYMPHVYGWVYNRTRPMKHNSLFGGWLHSFGRDTIRRIVALERPDAVIHTFPTFALPSLQHTGRPVLTGAVVTDFDLHCRWVHPRIDRYYVATPDMRKELISLGISESRVVVSGIPLKRGFRNVVPDPRIRARHGLDPVRPLVLIMAGAYGMLEGVPQILEGLLAHPDTAVALVSGRNEALADSVRMRFAGACAEGRLRVFGYVDHVHELMSVSSCVVTKPGGITLAEALAAGIPICTLRPVPGQERNNALYLESKGAAFVARNKDQLIAEILKLVHDPVRLKNRKKAVAELQTKNAAETIVLDILSRLPIIKGARFGLASVDASRRHDALDLREGGRRRMLPSRKARLFDSEMYLIFVILFLVEFIRGAALISFLPIYGEKMLGLPLGIIGIGITAHYLTDTLLKIAIGYLLDKFSIRFIVHASLLLSVAGVILFPFAAQPWLFITASALFGIGISPIWIVCLTKVDESRRATQMGFLYTIWFVGLGAGPIVCNFAIHRGMEHAYELLFVCTALAWFLSLFTSNRRMADIVTLPLSEQMRVLKDKLSRMKLLLPGMVLQTTGAAMLVPILPRFAEIRLGLTPPQYSLLLTAGGLCTVAALVPMGRLSDKVGNKKWFLVGGFSFFAVALYGLAWGPNLWQALLVAALLGVSYAAVLPAWNALLASYVPPQQRGLGWGIFSTVEGIGVMIGPVAGGYLASWQGEAFVVWISAVLFALIGLFYLWFPFRVFAENGAFKDR